MKTFYYIFVTAIAFLLLGRVCGTVLLEKANTQEVCAKALTFIDAENVDDSNDKALLNFSLLLDELKSDLSQCFGHSKQGMQYHFMHVEEYTFSGCILFEADSSPPSLAIC